VLKQQNDPKFDNNSEPSHFYALANPKMLSQSDRIRVSVVAIQLKVS
jgi:hypothetical protein